MQEAEPSRPSFQLTGSAPSPGEALSPGLCARASESRLSSGRQAALMPRKGASEQCQCLLCLKGPMWSWAQRNCAPGPT